MKVNFLSKNLGITNSQPIKCKSAPAQNYQTGLNKDTFVKSTKNISFGSADKAKYLSAKEELTQYFINAEKLSVEEIRKIIQKYSPEIGFDDIKNAPPKTNIGKGTVAYTYEPTQFTFNDNGEIKVESLPKTIYFAFKTIGYNEKEVRIILLDRLLHEYTHILQEEDGAEDRKIDFFNQYIVSNAENNMQIAINLQALNTVYNTVEQGMLGKFVASSPSSGSLPKEINRRMDIDTIFMKKNKMSAGTLASNLINNGLKLANANFGEIDKNLALDFVILKAKKEAEAYQNALDSNKELMGITSKTDFDLRIEMYQKIAETAEKMKK